MRIASLCLFLAACSGPTPIDPPAPELVFPSRHETAASLSIYARVDSGVANWANELTYALGDGFPEKVTLTPTGAIYVINGCDLAVATATWTSLTEVRGTAATLSLENGTLSVALKEEGEASAVLVGTVNNVNCMINGNAVTSLPLQQQISLRVRRVAGFVVTQLHQRREGCAEKVVLPAGATLWSPTVHPIDGSGQQFEAANAPVPVTMTLRSTGALSHASESWGLLAEPGHVDVLVETSKPVQGLKFFEVVSADALISVEASFVLRKAASKGSVLEPITEGGDYRLFFPGEGNLVDLDVTSATANDGPLCDAVPAAWFSATTSTPATCVPASGEQYGGGLPMALILASGVCALEVTIPNTSHRWAASFSTH